MKSPAARPWPEPDVRDQGRVWAKPIRGEATIGRPGIDGGGGRRGRGRGSPQPAGRDAPHAPDDAELYPAIAAKFFLK